MIRIGCAVIGVEESRVEDANVRRYGASRECDWTDGSCTLGEGWFVQRVREDDGCVVDVPCDLR